ncbi:DnaB-like helicase N-terminal domain-containing protein [Micromonospora sp. NPDC050276]|uniref:DnaB-like helicase N-terminal domain-containing protein n=1 Tax=Micromonospora sp. NPDC050276 TaxID=3364278 RepID=UPI003799BD9B
MSDLIMRAEQGVLGALLADPNQPLITDNLISDDFSHPAHRAIYNAILDTPATGEDPARIVAAVVAIVDRPDVDTNLLNALAAAAPDDQRVRAYSQIVIQAAFDRDTIDFAEPYLTAATQATDPVARDALVRLGQALTAQAETFAPASTIDPDQALSLPTVVALAAADLHPEDAIIADLLQHPEQARDVAAWLTSDVFTTDERRLTYELAVSIAYDHDPIDAVILAWNVERAREIQSLWAPHQRLPETLNHYTHLARLEVTAVAVGTAVTIGHDLVSEHVTVTLTRSASAAEAAATARSAEVEGPVAGLEPPRESSPTLDAPRIEL